MKLKLLTTKKEAGDATSFVFEPDTPIEWRAGEYLHYTLPHDAPDDRGTERWFTISSAPLERKIMLTTRFFGDEASSFKKRLFAMKPGDTIEADGLEGDFVIDASGRDYLFIAGGIGITPYRSMLLDLDGQGKEIKARLLYGNKDENIVFKDELEEIAARHPDFRIEYFIGSQKIDGEAIQTAAEELSSPIYYVSGPESMVEAFEEIFKDLGIPEENIRRDYFPGYAI